MVWLLWRSAERSSAGSTLSLLFLLFLSSLGPKPADSVRHEPRRREAIKLSDYHESIQHFDPHHFEENVQRGIWLMEFYSPRCPHCKDFLPFFNQLAKTYSDLEMHSAASLKLATIDCLKHDSFCYNQKNITAYPTLRIYYSAPKESFVQYEGAIYDYDHVFAFVAHNLPFIVERVVLNSLHKENLPGTPVIHRSPSSIISEFNARKNKEIKSAVIKITDKNFDRILHDSSGTGLIYLYSQFHQDNNVRLELFKRLSRDLDGKIWCAKADIDFSPMLSSRIGAQGESFVVHGSGRYRIYQGPVEFQNILEFALSNGFATVDIVTSNKIEQLLVKFDVVVAHVYYEDASPAATALFLDAIANMVFPPSVAHVAINVYKPGRMALPAPGTIAVYRRGYSLAKPDVLQLHPGRSNAKSWGAHQLNSPMDAVQHDVRNPVVEFLFKRQMALVPEVTEQSALDVLGVAPAVRPITGRLPDTRGDATSEKDATSGTNKPLVLLVVFEGTPDVPQVEMLENLARTAMKANEQVAWINGARWSEYMYRVYGVRRSALPAAIVCLPAPGGRGGFFAHRAAEPDKYVGVDTRQLELAVASIRAQVDAGTSVDKAKWEWKMQQPGGASESHPGASLVLHRRVRRLLSEPIAVLIFIGVPLIFALVCVQCCRVIRRRRNAYAKLE